MFVLVKLVYCQPVTTSVIMIRKRNYARVDVDDALNAWMITFLDVCDKHAPVKRRKVKRKQQPVWLSGKIVTAMQVRDKHKSQGRWEHYRIWRNHVTSMIDNAKVATNKHAIESNTNDSKQMWAHLRNLCPRDKAPTPLIIRDGELEITIPQGISNTFNGYFSTVANHYITDSTVDGRQHTLLKHFVNEKLDGVYTFPEITEHAVNKALLALKPGKSTGADTISARLLSAAAPAITMPITTIIIPPSHRRRGTTAVLVRHKPQWHRHCRRGSAVTPP